MRKIGTLLSALALSGALVVVPQAATAAPLTFAEAYDPQPFNPFPAEVGSAESGVILLDGLPSNDYISRVNVEFGESPYPINLAGNSFLPSFAKASIKPEPIYPAEFSVPFTATIIYTDGTRDTVSGIRTLAPIPTLVKDGEPIPADPTPELPTVTATTTVTVKPAPVTTTVISREPATATETTTATTTKTVAVPTTVATPTTVTETATVTKVAAPVTVTKTVATPGAATDKGSSKDGGLIGGIIAAIVAVLAALGGGAYWFLNMR